MPRYFFDLADGSREEDKVGTELRDEAAAEVEAIRFLGEVLKHEPHRLADGSLRVEVRDAARSRRRTIAATIEAPTAAR